MSDKTPDYGDFFMAFWILVFTLLISLLIIAHRLNQIFTVLEGLVP